MNSKFSRKTLQKNYCKVWKFLLTYFTIYRNFSESKVLNIVRKKISKIYQHDFEYTHIHIQNVSEKLNFSMIEVIGLSSMLRFPYFTSERMWLISDFNGQEKSQSWKLLIRMLITKIEIYSFQLHWIFTNNFHTKL